MNNIFPIFFQFRKRHIMLFQYNEAIYYVVKFYAHWIKSEKVMLSRIRGGCFWMPVNLACKLKI